ncbi:PH domain-containing protein [Lactiplantibacillus xiangfangensis]|uniref:YdbS-like PH domain-containing protein n=1 Tax=Lactiplantibacillus xiangfangensis TaxID=942150 RepID=A0A0R2MHR1_9LACO|nr:PH domain-containing protein [Lactiplantibacillus xiangfangensis]KRO11682.1 hypothetical protein IV64_GL002199 [Lactiplantibacillus xiangfangensis]
MTEQLPRQIKAVWRYSAWISGAIGLLISAGLWVASVYWHWWLWLWIAAIILSVLDVIVELALIPYRYAFWRYRITDNAVYLKNGVIFQHEIAVPISRIQNVTLAAGPLLQSVTVETAASGYKIDGVTSDVADQLRDRIMVLAQGARDEA